MTAGRRGEAGNPDTVELVTRARGGDSEAWNAIVDRFATLIWAIARDHNLRGADAAEVSQTTWLRLVEHLDDIRDPRALPGWLAATARNTALGIIRGANRVEPDSTVGLFRADDGIEVDAALMQTERHRALVEAMSSLEPADQQLLRLLCAEPRLSYAEISEISGRPIGSIGPTRQRIINRLRHCTALATLLRDTRVAA